MERSIDETGEGKRDWGYQALHHDQFCPMGAEQLIAHSYSYTIRNRNVIMLSIVLMVTILVLAYKLYIHSEMKILGNRVSLSRPSLIGPTPMFMHTMLNIIA